MNFDGKAFVKNTTTRTFISTHGYSNVRDIRSNDINNFSLTLDNDTAYVQPMHLTNMEILKPIDIIYTAGLIPYTIQVINKHSIQSLCPQTFILTRDNKIHNVQDDFKYYAKQIYISRLQPTNIKYNPKTAIIYDSEEKESILSFAGTTVNVNSKVEVIIPDKTSNYTDMSLIVQKNSFIEIKMLDNVSDVTNLPEDLIYFPGYIKGTFTKSGEYNIKIKYPDGEQILNIIVPYYQRML